MHNIENCVIINTPPSTSVEQVLLALDKHYPALTGAMSCVIKGQRGLRFPKAADLDTLVANGLTIGKTLWAEETSVQNYSLNSCMSYEPDGRGTRRGTGSMLWNDELWTEEERAQVDAIWRAREG
ncbi:BQ5605_C025g09998 [Microbotryum silenes-dioicae]|uniref:BQ5605_C025g09998 protein n=1 Tax=Microbotryum silenes-dioicae TaxID=796604 RepID=A0A2X0N8H0_9BASI|nr:BQ5605_C025g09998 [Microbotryum silenes-dioicae]